MFRTLTLIALTFGIPFSSHAQNLASQVIAGWGYQAGFAGDGGPATSARLNSPRKGSFDKQGNLYFADTGNHRIRKISTTGIISTVAGNGTPAFSGDGGSSLTASLNRPEDVVVDGSGSLIIADTHNGRIRKVTPNGLISTIAGCGCPSDNTAGNGGPALQAPASALDLEISPSGEIYFASEYSNENSSIHALRKITADGRIVTINKTPISIQSLAFDPRGNLFVSDTTSIYSVSNNGYLSRVAGGGTLSNDGALALETNIGNPRGIEFDKNGLLYFTDYSNHRVRVIGSDGRVRTISSGYAYPTGVTIRPGVSGGVYMFYPSSLVIVATTEETPYKGPFQPKEALIDDIDQHTSGLDSDMQGCTYGCNPVDLVSGAKLDYAVDYQNHSPFPIILDRRYDSRAGKWVWGYERRIHQTSQSGIQKAHLYRPDGSIISFQRTSSSAEWQPSKPTYLGALSDAPSGGFKYLNLQNIFENYNSDGRLTSLENLVGNKISFSYSPKGEISRISDEFGRFLTITKTEDLTSISMVFFDGDKSVSYLFERGIQEKPLLKRVTHEDGTQKQYLYDEGGMPGQGLLTGIVAEDGTRYATYTYDASGTVSSTEHGNGQDFTVYTIQPGQSASVSWETGSATFPLSNPTPGSESKTRGSSTPCPNCGGASVPQIVYNTQGVPTSFTSYEGIETSRTVNSRGVTETEVYASNSSRKTTTHYTWHPTLRLLLSMEQEVIAGFSPTKLTTSFTYDASNRLIEKTETTDSNIGGTANSRTTAWTYNSKGQVLTETNGATGTTTFTYDPSNGNLLTSTNAVGHVTSYSDYSAKGKSGTMVDPNGLHTFFQYNSRGQTTHIARGSSPSAFDTTVINMAYTPNGQIQRISRPDGFWVQYDYDSAQRLVKITDPRGRMEQTLNNDGDVIARKVFDTSGQMIRSQTQTYDALRQLKDQVDANNKTTTVSRHPQTQQVLTISDPDFPGVAGFSQTYDNLQQPETQTTGSAEQERTTWTQSDRTGQLTYAIDGNGVYTAYAYNGFGEPWAIESSDAGTKGFQRDAGGRIYQTQDGRLAFSQKHFDAIGRVTQVIHRVDTDPEVEFQSFVYDSCDNGVGRLCHFTDHSGTTSYRYDLWGRVVWKTFTPAGASMSLTTEYIYNQHGQLISTRYPSGKRADYTYNQGVLTAIAYDFQLVVNNVIYRPFTEEVKGWTWGPAGAGQVTISYDLNGRVSRIEDVDDRHYERNHKGWITAITDPLNPSANQSYVYNQTGFLKKATLAARPDPIVYGVDNNDNMASKSVGALPEDIQKSDYLTNLEINNQPASHQDSQGPTYTPLFDGAGNMTDDGDGLTLVYDAKGRVRSSNRRGHQATYAYNSFGQRMRKSDTTLSTGHRFYAYDEAGRVLGEYDGTGKALEEYVYLDGYRPVAVARNLGLTESPDIYPILTDHLGTPRKILNPSGTLVWSWDAKDPYGYQAPNELESGTVFTFDLRFPGQRYDKQTGLFHNGFRDYDPKFGRYVQADPIGLEGGWNHYTYASANPINHSDSTGLVIDGKAFESSDFRQALRYLSSSPTAAHIIDRVSKSKRVMELQISGKSDNHYKDNHAYGFSLGGTINWDPRFELYCENSGKSVSPALQLLHEMVHFLQYENRADALKKRSRHNNEQWQTGLEYYAISTYEAAAAWELGELVRKSHTLYLHDEKTHEPIRKIYTPRKTDRVAPLNGF